MQTAEKTSPQKIGLLGRHIQIAGERLMLLPERAIWWERERALLVSDVHLGKAGHFRAHGIPVPHGVGVVDRDRLLGVIRDCKPLVLYVLGDLFHAGMNTEWELVLEIGSAVQRFVLIAGNHDRLAAEAYARAGIELQKAPFSVAPFVFCHTPEEARQSAVGSAIGGYALHGHVHPAVRLSARSNVRKKLPCFLFGETVGVLPAFGAFTGTCRISPTDKDRVFVTTDQEVFEIPLHHC